MKAIDRIQEICEQELIDNVTGPMFPRNIAQEVGRTLETREPEHVVVVMTRKEMEGKPLYQTSIYMSKEDFKKYKNPGLIYPVKQE